ARSRLRSDDAHRRALRRADRGQHQQNLSASAPFGRTRISDREMGPSLKAFPPHLRRHQGGRGPAHAHKRRDAAVPRRYEYGRQGFEKGIIPLRKLAAVLLFFALCVPQLPAGAAPPRSASPAAASTPPPDPGDGDTPDAVTSHTAVIGGAPIAYTARAGTITLRNEKEQPTARVFYTAYTIDGVDPSSRPVTFLYNGG